MTAVRDDDFLGGFAALSAACFQFLNDVHTFDDSAEYDVLVVEPRGLLRGDEELRAIGVRTSIGHRHNSGSGVLQNKVLILKFVAVDRFSASAIVIGEVTALAHKVWNDAMERATLVTETFLARA